MAIVGAQRITSPRVWFGAGGQGVTLKLAWGPSNSSPRNLHFVFAVFSLFFFLYHNFHPICTLIFFFWEIILSVHCVFFVFTYIRFWYFSVPFFPFLSFLLQVLVLSTFTRSYHHFYVLFSFIFGFWEIILCGSIPIRPSKGIYNQYFSA